MGDIEKFIHHFDSFEEEKERLEISIHDSDSDNFGIINMPTVGCHLILNNLSETNSEKTKKIHKNCSIFDGKIQEIEREKRHLTWEYVIICNNPKKSMLKNSKITYEYAENLYLKAFKRKKNKDPTVEEFQYKKEIKAFREKFENLENFPGGLSEKMLVNGSSYDKKNQEAEANFLKPPSDFTSLVLESIFRKLVSHLGLTVKKVTSANRKYIYFLITAEEEIFENEAERISFNKQLEISLSDLISIFPCDSTLRPLHLLKCREGIIDKLSWKIRKFFHDVFGTCEYSDEQMHKHKAVDIFPLQLDAYEFFLKSLNEKIKKMKKKMNIDFIPPEEIIAFGKLARTSLNEVNKTLKDGEKLKNLWDHLNILKPIAPYVEYRRSSRKDEFHELWRTHLIGSNKEKSLFRIMERIRLLNSYIFNYS